MAEISVRFSISHLKLFCEQSEALTWHLMRLHFVELFSIPPSMPKQSSISFLKGSTELDLER